MHSTNNPVDSAPGPFTIISLYHCHCAWWQIFSFPISNSFLLSNSFLISNPLYNIKSSTEYLQFPCDDDRHSVPHHPNSNNLPSHSLPTLHFKSNVDPTGSANRSIGTCPGPQLLRADGHAHHHSACAVHDALFVVTVTERETEREREADHVNTERWSTTECIMMHSMDSYSKHTRNRMGGFG